MFPAPFAADPAASRGRLFHEPESRSRTPFQRDRDRIIHSSAFRRLKHKTQVFVYHEGDHYRTRLTHSLEVSQIARSIARTLGLDEDLAEALSLAHDLGHPAFGHAGEDALATCMEEFGGFDHNAQTLKVVTKLEHRYADFDGLNLTWEVLEGLVKHNGPLRGAVAQPIASYNTRHDLELATWPCAEAQVAAIADDIAYNNHDIDDGLRAGLFSTDDLMAVPVVETCLDDVDKQYPGVERSRVIHETVRRLIGAMVEDVVTESRQRIDRANVCSADEVRSLDGPLIGFSTTMQAHDRELKSFLFDNMYRHYKVNRMMSKAKRLVTELFRLYMAEPGVLPAEYCNLVSQGDEAVSAAVICDFIAGMTDRFAIEEHRRLFDLTESGL